jgi:AcrR family transcriptional regulator
MAADLMESKRPQRMAHKQRHQQLLDTAIRVFAQKGFKGTTTKEIAEAAGITQAVIFQHFASKDEFYSAIINHKVLQSEAHFRKTLQQAARRKNDRAVFKTLASQILNYYLRDPDYIRLLLYSSLESHELSDMFVKQEVLPLYTFLSDYIEQRMKDRAVRPMNPLVAARAFFGMVHNHALVQILYKDPILQISVEEATDQFVNIFMQGIMKCEL